MGQYRYRTTAWSAWLSENSLASNIAPKYFTVTDSLSKLDGGDGVDTLVDIEKIVFSDTTYFLEIRTISPSNSMQQEIIGTSGNDNFVSFTNDTAGVLQIKITTLMLVKVMT